MKQLLALVTALLAGSTALAAKQAKNTYTTPDVPFEELYVPDFAAIGKELAKNKQKRMPAEALEIPAGSSMDQFRKDFLAIGDSRHKLHDFLVKYDNPDFYNDPKVSADAKYFAAQAALIRPLRSVIYRLRHLFENTGGKITHSMSVTTVRNLAAFVSVYLPSSQWKAGFDYVTAPFENGVDEYTTLNHNGQKLTYKTYTNYQFKTVAEVQKFVFFELNPRVKAAIRRIADVMDKAGDPKSPFVWDNALLYPSATFKYKDGANGGLLDNPERFHVHGKAEVGLVLSALYASVHRGAMFCAYKQEDLFAIVKKMGTLQGIDAWFNGADGELGVSKWDRVAIIKEGNNVKFPEFLVLWDGKYDQGRNSRQHKIAADDVFGKKAAGNPGWGKFLMNEALGALRGAVAAHVNVWAVVREAQTGNVRDNVSTIINPLVLQAGTVHTDMQMKALSEMLKGPYQAFSTITGERVTINVPEMFTSPSEDLKLLMPTAQKSVAQHPDVISEGKPLKWRNYYAGQAGTWNMVEWSKYVQPEQGNMADALRILRQAWGGDMVAGPMAFAIK
ncbi:MAG TPA: hypothetical protein VFV50_08225 [Bdellovibrionales bacterium]|nr:hypothetical protein [Bdellovibrionales bacterium]